MVQPTIQTTQSIDWQSLIPYAEWELYKLVIDRMREENIPFALGGGLAFSEYSARVRNTKDLDLYVLPWDRERAREAVLAAGFEDYFDVKNYDRSWIFRGHKGDVIVDVIWTSPNHRFLVDPEWLSNGRVVSIYGTQLRLIPPEELIWAKMYVLQHDRCDWPDIFNVIAALGSELRWGHLLDRVGTDAELLASIMAAYRWVAPEQATRLPAWLWARLGLAPRVEDRSGEMSADRVHILDTRDWFGPKETLSPQP